MNRKITFSLILAILCLCLATIQSIRNKPDVDFWMGMACFNLIAHFGIRQEEK